MKLPLKTIHLAKELITKFKSTFKDKGYNISFEEWVVLVHVGKFIKISQNKLKNFTGKDKHFTSRLISSLERKGFIFRKQSDTDSRQNIIILTENGERLFEELIEIQKELFNHKFNILDNNEMEDLNTILSKLLQN